MGPDDRRPQSRGEPERHGEPDGRRPEPDGHHPPDRHRRPEPRARADRNSGADPSGEPDPERSERQLGELLQELRVAGVGVQVLTGFLLSLPFTSRFGRLDGVQQDLYLASLALAVTATALLMGPVAYHRLVFHRGQRASLVRTANALAIGGLAAVSLAICTAVALVASSVAGATVAAVFALLAVALFAGLWFAFPLSRR